MSSILVLGGAGYIGSHTVYELIAAGENVVVVDNLEISMPVEHIQMEKLGKLIIRKRI